ncbi:MAG TPA: T9SS type A sorting domain-containing protein, partial [Bacteroidia bacterium]|nr:T9SS type A sorting domain-containing protein [Bacteroidia bacterium]
VNLVVNPSFEDTIQCVPTHSRFQGYVADWRGGRGEYFSQYCQGFQVEVPANIVGNQYPHTGAAYAGIYTVSLDNVPSHVNFRDYIEGQLDTNLIRGERYYVGVFVSLAEINQYVTSIQFRFTSDTLTYDQYLIPMSASVEETNLTLLADTANWIWVGGYYTAHGMETHLVIGNFMYDSLTPLLMFNSSAVQPTCYYYIDDVAVYRVADARAGSNIQICLGDSLSLGDLVQDGIKYNWSTSYGLSDSTAAKPVASPQQTTTYILTIQDTTGYYFPGILSDTVTVFVDSCISPEVPVPWFIPTLISGSDHLISGIPPTGLQVTLYDDRGRLVYREDYFTNTVTAERFAPGLYILVIFKNDGTQIREKVTIAK